MHHPLSAIFPADNPNAARSRWAGAVLTIWLAATAVLFWHFEARFYLPSNQQLVEFDREGLPAAPAASGLRALYFLAGNCPCERGALRQIESLQTRFGSRLQQWVSFAAPIETGLPANVGLLDGAASALWRHHIPAYPAAAVWDGSGALVYFGPLADGPDCGGYTNTASYVALTLQRLTRGEPALPAPRIAAGCLCQGLKPALAAN